MRSEKSKAVNEAKAPTHYHSVFYKHESGKWHHHFDADSREDAAEERSSLRSSGERHVKVLRVPKHEANWHKRDVHEYVSGRLKEDLDEDAPTNSMGTSSSTTGQIRTYDPMVSRHRKRTGLLRRMVRGKYQSRV